MKQEISNRKIFFYSIVLYLMLFVSEMFLNCFSFLKRYSGGKVGSSLFSKVKECLELLKYDIAIYILTLISIYIIFSFINYKYVVFFYKALSKKKPLIKNNLTKIFLFFLINFYFVFVLYLFNHVSYPHSNIASFTGSFINPKNYQLNKILAYFLISIYFIFLFYFILKHKKRRATIFVCSFLVFFSIFNFLPCYHLKNIFYPIIKKNNNLGPNIIIIGIDSLNPKHTGYFGYTLNTTPNLDRFLEENIVFRKCYTPLARTFPSWYSILTGQYPATNGVRYNLIKRKFINPYSETLAKILKTKKNYFTCYFTDETRFSNILKEDGFDYLRHPLMGVKDFVLGTLHDFSLTNVFFNNPLGYKLFNFLDINRGVYHLYKPNYFTNELISFLSLLKTKEKFLLAIHFCAPHWPYISSAPYPFLYADETNLFTQYDGALRMADDQLGRFLNALKKKGLYDNSIIIVLSDHGESLGGHGFNLKSQDQNHILLSIKPIKNNKHFEVEELVSTIDIAPTILDLLDEGLECHKFDGHSLTPLISGFKTNWDFNNSIFLETGFSFDTPGGIGLSFQQMIDEGISFYEFDKNGFITVREELHRELIDRKQRAVQTLKWKLISIPLVRKNMKKNTVSLYDLINDPECENDVSEIYLNIFNKLLKLLSQYYK